MSNSNKNKQRFFHICQIGRCRTWFLTEAAALKHDNEVHGLNITAYTYGLKGTSLKVNSPDKIDDLRKIRDEELMKGEKSNNQHKTNASGSKKAKLDGLLTSQAPSELSKVSETLRTEKSSLSDDKHTGSRKTGFASEIVDDCVVEGRNCAKAAPKSKKMGALMNVASPSNVSTTSEQSELETNSDWESNSSDSNTLKSSDLDSSNLDSDSSEHSKSATESSQLKNNSDSESFNLSMWKYNSDSDESESSVEWHNDTDMDTDMDTDD